MARGKLISFEGIDGCGKSSLVSDCVRHLKDCGIDAISVAQSSSTEFSKHLFSLMTDRKDLTISLEAETFLVLSARAEIYSQIVKKALDKGIWVVHDRYLDSTLVFQQREESTYTAQNIKVLHDISTGGERIAKTFLIDALPSVAKIRMPQREFQSGFDKKDEAWHEINRQKYLELAEDNPRFCIIENNGPYQEAFEKLITELNKLIN